jgi:hypothetical protein
MWEAFKSGELHLYGEKLTASERLLLYALRRHSDGGAIARVLAGDLLRLQEARAKHVDFAFGQWEAIGYLEAEVGETTQEVVKGHEGWEARMDDELKDVRVVALRISLREYEHDGEN